MAGVIEVIIGLGHFAFPELTLKSGGYLQLMPNEVDFIITGLAGLGFNLTAFGTLTIICGLKYEIYNRFPIYLTVAQALKYSARVITELIFPVSVPLIFKEPFVPVLSALVLLWLLHSSAVLLILKEKRSEKQYRLG